MKRIVLCADDYGQAPFISKGILHLVSKRRLSASSCIVTGQDFIEHANWLKPYQHDIDIGLHFNLTEGVPLSKEFIDTYGQNLFPLKILLMKSILKKLDQTVIEAECHAQIDRFITSFGFEPAFIDGHQHVHQFPIVRDSLLNAYRARFSKHRPYLRWIGAGNRFHFKRFIIQHTGGNAFRHLLKLHHIPHNTSFSGIYLFSKSHAYPQLFPHFLRGITDGGIIMCHPGLPEGLEGSIIGRARGQEYAYFLGDGFLEACRDQRAVLSRF